MSSKLLPEQLKAEQLVAEEMAPFKIPGLPTGQFQQGQFNQLFPVTQFHSTYFPVSNALDKTSHLESVPALYACNIF